MLNATATPPVNTGLSIYISPESALAFRLAIRQALRRKNMSAAQLGRKLGVSRGRIAQVLSDSHRLSAEAALVLSAELGVRLDKTPLLPELGRFVRSGK